VTRKEYIFFVFFILCIRRFYKAEETTEAREMEMRDLVHKEKGTNKLELELLL
jgi:hypothetical protein